MRQQQTQLLHMQQRQRLQQQQLQIRQQQQQLHHHHHQQQQQQQLHHHRQQQPQQKQQPPIVSQRTPPSLTAPPLPTLPLSKSTVVPSSSSMMPQAPQHAMMQNQSSSPALSSSTNGIYNRQLSMGTSFHADDSATVRVSSAMRSKMQGMVPSVPQGNSNLVNGFGSGFVGQSLNQNLGKNLNSMVQNQDLNNGQTQSHGQGQRQHMINGQVNQYAALRSAYHQRALQAQMNGTSGGEGVNLQMGPANLNLKLPTSRPAQMPFRGSHTHSPIPMHTSPPHPNMNMALNGSPILHARSPSMNGHLMAPAHHPHLQGRGSPANPHFAHSSSPLAHPSLPGSPHHPANFAPPLQTPTPPRTASGLMHHQIVGAAGQGQQYL
jgi:hypothetical protein